MGLPRKELVDAHSCPGGSVYRRAVQQGVIVVPASLPDHRLCFIGAYSFHTARIQLPAGFEKMLVCKIFLPTGDPRSLHYEPNMH